MARKRPTKKAATRSKANDYDDVVDRIVDIGDVDSYLKCLYYGRSGTGKTTVLCSMPKPMLLLDIKEEGTDSVKDVEGIKVLPVKSWEDIENIYWYLSSGDHPYKSVGLDTVTQLQELAMKHVLADEGKEFASMQIRGKVSELMKTWLLNFRDLPLHVGFTAQDRVTETDTEEEDQIMPEVGPAVSPGIAKTLNAMVKFIGQTYIQEVVSRSGNRIDRKIEYRLRVGPHPYYLTKTRKPKKVEIPLYLVDASFDDIIKLQKGEYKEKSDKPRKSKRKKK